MMSTPEEVRAILATWRTRDKELHAATAAKYEQPPDAKDVASLIFDYGLSDDVAEELLALPTRNAALERAVAIKTQG